MKEFETLKGQLMSTSRSYRSAIITNARTFELEIDVRIVTVLFRITAKIKIACDHPVIFLKHFRQPSTCGNANKPKSVCLFSQKRCGASWCEQRLKVLNEIAPS